MHYLFLLFFLFFSESLFTETTQFSLLGGKAESLSRLEQIPEVHVPKWFCIPTDQFKEFVDKNSINEKIESLNSIADEESLFEKAKEIRELILASPFPYPLHQQLKKNLNETMRSCPAVAVRSSCIFEDLPDSSFAGIYDTFLNQRGLQSIEEAVKKCWASVFNDRAILERNRKEIDHKKALIAVIIQEMVAAKTAGTAFTMEIGTGYEGIEIVANYGLGEGVVDGEITADKWLVHPQTDRMIKSTLGSKKFKVISNQMQGEGVSIEKCNKEEMRNYSLDFNTVKKIAMQVKKIASYYHCPHLDTEFAIDEKGELYFLQARPIVQISANEIQVIAKESSKDAPILARGRYSVPGAVTGKLKVIESFEDLAEGRTTVEPNDIVVTYVSTNKWSQYMTKFKGMITQEGGPTSHPILLCRERKVPCVIGISPEAFSYLLSLNGKEVTLDGIGQIVYQGRLELKTATPEDLAAQFELLQEEILPSYEEQVQTFKDYNMLLVEKDGDQEILWQKKPDYPLDPLMQDINLIGYRKRAPLLGLKEFPSEAKVLNDHVVEKFMTDREKLLYFSHMDLEKSEAFIDRLESTLEKYQKITENFSLSPENWSAYVDAMATLRSYIWLGYPFRIHANNQVVQESRKLQIPRFYVESYAEQVQSQFTEEDTLMVEAIRNMATSIEPYSGLKLYQLKNTAPEIYKQLEELAKQYRFQDNLSFNQELDLEIVFHRVIQEIQNLNGPWTEAKNIQHDFFPEDEVLRRWITVAIKSRVLQSNAHQKIIRGQWKVRDALLSLEKGKEIFNYSTDEIHKML